MNSHTFTRLNAHAFLELTNLPLDEREGNN
jgi:hypothetical protein